MSETRGTNVITVALSPSLDRTLITHYLAVGYQNRAEESTRLDPAGEAVDIARALHRLIQSVHAIIVLGDDATGRSYQALLSAESFEYSIIQVKGGRTPSNTIILDTGNHTETQILEEGTGMSRDDLVQVVHVLRDKVRPGDIVVFAGPLPPGVPANTYAWMTEMAHEAGAEVVLATGGEALREGIKARPDFVAISRLQAEAFFNYPVRTREHVVESARQLVAMGAPMVLTGIRSEGEAILVSETGEWYADLRIGEEEGTTSGVWDAFVAGFVAGRLNRQPYPESLELAAAAAAYTASHIGHEFPTLQDVYDYMKQVQVMPFDELDKEPLSETTNGPKPGTEENENPAG